MRRRREAQRGQVAILVALMSTLLIAVTALAVDLGVQINDQRHLQNIADSAALSGAFHLPGTGCPVPVEVQAVTDAINAVSQTMGWGTTWYTLPAPPAYSSTSCPPPASAVYSSGPLSHGGYTVTASSPAASARNPAYRSDDRYLSVDITQTVVNSFAQIIGFAQSAVAAHAVAFHYGPGTTEPWALWSGTIVASGNYQEDVQGDLYAATGLQMQSSGKASICAEYVPSTTTGGHIVLGYGTSPPSSGITYNNSCSAPSGGNAYAQAVSGDCPSTTWVQWDASIDACVADPPLVAPQVPQPGDYSGATIQPLTNCNPGGLSPGIYSVSGSDCPLLKLSGVYDCVSFVINNSTTSPPGGPTIDFTGNGGFIRAYGAGPDTNPNNPSQAAQDTSTYGITGTASQPPLASKCPAYGHPEDMTALYEADNGNPTPNYPVNCNTNDPYCMLIDGPGNGKPPFTLVGAIAMPNYEFYTKSNANFVIIGSATVGEWNDQSGNHPNIVITYNAGNTPPEEEQLRLVE